jgi:S-sulfosulfanyl-L-cysteine sulfohydrolase
MAGRVPHRCRRAMKVLLAVSAVLYLMPATAAELTLIHMGDVHGHLMPRPSMRAAGPPKTEGGLARMFSRITEIRSRQDKTKTLLLNTGDTIQGSAEALFTRGGAVVDVLNRFGIDGYVLGNWDWVYGTERTLELFAGSTPKAPWNALAANAYFAGEPYADRAGRRVFPPYMVREVGGIKVGLLGFTTDRGPQVVGRDVTKGIRFTKGDDELKEFVKVLREQEKVALVVMMSELGLSNNIRLAEQTPGVDVILSSDMHEITREPFLTATKTLVVEVGQDGQVLGELNLSVEDARIKNWKWTLHRIDESIKPEAGVAKVIADIRKPFLAGGFKPQVNPFNGTTLTKPINTVVGTTKVTLHRSSSSDQSLPAVMEGTSHDFLTDAFRAQADADIGAIRGFRYGTVVRPGPIKLEDLYHFIPIGPMIAKGTITGKQVQNQIENSADGSLNPDVAKWTGGWLFGFSGIKAEIDPYAKPGEKAKNILVADRKTKSWKPLEVGAEYTYASYYYARDPNLINAIPATNVAVVKDKDGKELDAVDLVTRYLDGLPNRTVNLETGRLKLLKPLPGPISASPEIQPWRGSVERKAASEKAGMSPQPTRP